ncbi:hypothetical protein Q8W71_14075 [Methylobacterium sp. NEAU 140]|uniref:hypothetical protein n=1 Tax=Methylobacterium sp. NEAU 140 TaxID=3064945 RepID=UPI0027376DC6|nr:hypothetical protein [Methylobacterium sp. NEAU 140]MDP4023759.1 hypothetical protein [Methylobacterium sp. NEAU 140]
MPLARVLPASLLACAVVTAATAQQSVYIGQIDPQVAQGVNPGVARTARGNGQAAGDGIVYSASGSPVLPSQPSFLPANGSGLQGAVTAAGQAGSLGAGMTNNIAVINQAGSGNLGTIAQTGFNNVATATVMGNNNVTSQTQDGSSNRSAIGIAGNANAITTSQIGIGNSTAVDLSGSGYSVNTTQVGSGLSYGLTVNSTTASDKIITVDQRNSAAANFGFSTGLSTGTRGATVSATGR